MLLQIETQSILNQAVQATQPIVQSSESIPVMDLALKGGWIMIPLLLLFAVTIYISVERWIMINRSSREPSNFMQTIRDFVHEGRLDSALLLCNNTDSPIARMVAKGITRIGKPLNDINAAIENVGKIEVSKLENHLAWLSTSAGAAPMIGFLGTVVGMVRVFFDMASKGNNIEVATLANGMYQAMVTTVAGLIVGILAYIGYNYLVSRIEKLVSILEARTTEFMDLLQEPAQSKKQ
ncbi:biopolymer transporter ExbB [Bacteroidia bacterium]|nr:biopolymer transporter ExbB [Bacteroidia bacterium]